MAKKPPVVSADTAREWLRRNEAEGETPPQIAEKVGYDVRTVRKYIASAKEEREKREARQAVLCNAMEEHFRDLCKFASSINSNIDTSDPYYVSSDDVFIEAALREHLPRSPLWRNLKRRDEILEKLDNLKKDLNLKFQRDLREDPALTEVISSGGRYVVEGLANILTAQLLTFAQKGIGLNIETNYTTTPKENGLLDVQYGAYSIQGVKREHEPLIRKLIPEYETKLRSREEFDSLEKLSQDLKRIKGALREECALITHRRVVPGHCKFCPA